MTYCCEVFLLPAKLHTSNVHITDIFKRLLMDSTWKDIDL